MPLEDTISTSNLKQARKEEAISTLKTRVGHFMKETNLAASIGDIPTKLAKTSAVLIVLRYNEQVSTSSDDCWDVLLTLRSNQMRSHRGLVCLPGGKMELGEDATQCALREAKEEVDLNGNDVDVIGAYSPTVTTNNMMVFPVLAILNPGSLCLSPNPNEVEDIFWMPLSQFLMAETHRSRNFTALGFDMTMHYFDYSPSNSTAIYTVWGLTSRILMVTAYVVLQRSPEFKQMQDPLLLGYPPYTKSELTPTSSKL